MDFDREEYMRVTSSRDDFDSRAFDRTQMQVSQFKWAPAFSAGFLATNASPASTSEYCDGLAPTQDKWQFVGGGWKPGGEARVQPTAYARKYGAARKHMNTQISRLPVHIRRHYPLLPGSVLPPPEGGATAGMTKSMANQMGEVYRGRLQDWEDEVVEQGWGSPPGEAAGYTGGSKAAPPGIPQLGYTLRETTDRDAINAAQTTAAVPASVQQLSDNLFSVERDLLDPVKRTTVKFILQGAITNARALAEAPVDFVKKWRELVQSMLAKVPASDGDFADADDETAELKKLLSALDEILRIDYLYATHGMRRTDRLGLIQRLGRALYTVEPEDDESIRSTMRSAESDYLISTGNNTAAERRASNLNAPPRDHDAFGLDDIESRDYSASELSSQSGAQSRGQMLLEDDLAVSEPSQDERGPGLSFTPTRPAANAGPTSFARSYPNYPSTSPRDDERNGPAFERIRELLEQLRLTRHKGQVQQAYQGLLINLGSIRDATPEERGEYLQRIIDILSAKLEEEAPPLALTDDDSAAAASPEDPRFRTPGAVPRQTPSSAANPSSSETTAAVSDKNPFEDSWVHDDYVKAFDLTDTNLTTLRFLQEYGQSSPRDRNNMERQYHLNTVAFMRKKAINSLLVNLHLPQISPDDDLPVGPQVWLDAYRLINDRISEDRRRRNPVAGTY